MYTCKKHITALLLMLMASMAGAADYKMQSTNGGDGHINGSFPKFTLTGADNGNQISTVPGEGVDTIVSLTRTVDVAQTMHFDWSYLTRDLGGAMFDPAGYLLNGKLFQLTPEYSAPDFDTRGSTSLTLRAGDTFGWYVSSIGSNFGSASLSVSILSNIQAVPEPQTYAMLLAGLGLLGFMARRRRDGSAT